MEENTLDIIELIQTSYYDLTATEQRVADYVMAEYDRVQYMSITQLAEECGTGEATISRFCRSLKLKGFNAFKLELARYCASRKKPVGEDIPDTPLGQSMEVARRSADAVYQTIGLLDPNSVERAVALIEKAQHVVCIGSGGSLVMAEDCRQVFSNVTHKFQVVNDSHSQLSTASIMGENDLLILFSYSGATTAGIRVLEKAKENNVPTVLVTRFNKSPASALADVVLCCGSNESPFQSGSVTAKIAQLVVIDVVFHEYYRRNKDKCDRAIRNIASSLSELHL